jgi:hypothetical protein
MTDAGSKIMQRLIRFYGSSCQLAGPDEGFAIARQWQASRAAAKAAANEPVSPDPDGAARASEPDKAED